MCVYLIGIEGMGQQESRRAAQAVPNWESGCGLRIWRVSGRLMSRCQLKALPPRIEREKGRAPAFCVLVKHVFLYSCCIHR